MWRYLEAWPTLLIGSFADKLFWWAIEEKSILLGCLSGFVWLLAVGCLFYVVDRIDAEYAAEQKEKEDFRREVREALQRIPRTRRTRAH